MRVAQQLLSIIATSTLLATPAFAGPEKPDVYVIVWDATRPDHLTPYGYERDTTPNLDKLAKKGMLFTHAQSTAPWTVPSVAGLFTGMFSHNHNVDYHPTAPTLDLTTDVHTLAEAMKDNGYATSLSTVQGIYYKQEGFKQGFDTHKRANNETVLLDTLKHIDANASSPVFSVLYWLDPHAPYEPSPEHDLWSDKSADPVNISGSNVDKPGYFKHGDLNRNRASLTAGQYAQLQAKYDGELHANDARLGRFMKALENRGRLDNTIFVFTSDHGEGFNEHDRQKVWHDLPYETILNVPLVISGPGIPQGKTVDSLVRTIDIYPTVLEAIGAQAPSAIDGESLIPLASGGAKDRVNTGTSHFAGAVTFYTDGKHKLMFGRNGAANLEVYDLAADKGEQKNLSTNGELVADLKKRREELIGEGTKGVGASGTKTVGAEELKLLCELGYMAGPDCEGL